MSLITTAATNSITFLVGSGYNKANCAGPIVKTNNFRANSCINSVNTFFSVPGSGLQFYSA